MKKKILALLLCGCMIFCLAACGSKNDTADNGDKQESTTKDDSKESYKVGICQLVQHDALDAATQGFKDALNEALPGQVTFDEQNASGDTPTCATIINTFVSDKVDLILANATAPLQAAASATSEIPILGTSITDYATALEISDWTGTVGGNISGTSDLAPWISRRNSSKNGSRMPRPSVCFTALQNPTVSIR